MAQIEGGNITDLYQPLAHLNLNLPILSVLKGASESEPMTKGIMAVSFDGKVKNKATEAVAFLSHVAGNTKGITIDEPAQGVDPTDVSITEDDFNSLTAAVSFTADLNTQLNAARVKLTTTRRVCRQPVHP